jgi:hypothetical protein
MSNQNELDHAADLNACATEGPMDSLAQDEVLKRPALPRQVLARANPQNGCR